MEFEKFMIIIALICMLLPLVGVVLDDRDKQNQLELCVHSGKDFVTCKKAIQP